LKTSSPWRIDQFSTVQKECTAGIDEHFVAGLFLRINILGSILGYPIFALAHFFAGDNFFRLLKLL